MDEILKELIKTLPKSPTTLDETTVKKYIDTFRCQRTTKSYGLIL